MKKYLAIAALAALVGLVSCNKPDSTPAEKISVSPKSVTFVGDGGEQRVAVKSSSKTFTAIPDADWLTAQVSGKEIVLTATNNATKAERTAKVKVEDATSSCEIEVIQQIGSPVAGYAPIASMSYEYGGKMMFVTYVNETYGGCAYLTFTDLDGVKLSITCFTDLFSSEEEVCLTEGTYTAGKDDMMTYYAVPCTWMTGGFQESDYSDEGGFSYGSSVTLIDGTTLYLKEGTMEIKGNLVKIDMKDEQGNEYKYAYDGEYDLNVTASFGGSSDPTEDIYKVSCGVIDEADGVSNMCLTIYAGDPTAPTRSLIYFNIATPEDGVYNIAGTYSNPETPEDAGKVGTADLGYYVEFGDFKMAMGSSVIDADFNMWAADGMVILMVVPNEDGTYMIMARLADAEAVAAAESEEEAGISYLYMIMSTTIDMESEEADD